MTRSYNYPFTLRVTGIKRKNVTVEYRDYQIPVTQLGTQFEYLDYQIPVTQLWRYASSKARLKWAYPLFS